MSPDSATNRERWSEVSHRCYPPVRMRSIVILSVFCFCLSASGDGVKEDGVKVDNGFVHILEISQGPHSTRTMPRVETNRVLVSLGSANIQCSCTDGKRRPWKPGQVIWVPAGEPYTSDNSGTVPASFVQIELKNHGPASPTARRPELDPVVIDPKHNILVLENDQVRVFRSWREPGATEKMHEHAGAGRVAVLLTDINATVKVPDGSASALNSSFGDVLWSGPVIHATTNLGSKKIDMIVVEVK